MRFSKWLVIIVSIVSSFFFYACSDNKRDENNAAVQNPGDPPSGGDLQTVVFRRVVNNQPDIYMVKEDGSNLVALANSIDEERFQGITPSGRLIYWRYLDSKQGDLYTVNSDGSDLVAITHSPNEDTFQAVTPGGKIIFYNKSITYDLYMINDDGTGLFTIAASSLDDTFRGFTRSGRILYDQYQYRPYEISDIYIINEDGSERHTLANSGNIDSYLYETDDGHVIYYSSPPGNTVTNADVYSVKLDGTGVVALANTSAHEIPVGLSKTNRVLIHRETLPRQTALLSINSDGSGLVVLAEAGGALAVASSGRVIYAQGTLIDLYSVNADGTDPQPLANSADQEYFLAITAKEQVIYRRVYDNTQDDLLLINADGSGNLRLTDTADKHESFVHEAANGRIIFSTLSTTNPVLNGFYSINVDGTGLATLVADTSKSVYFIDETPSGRLIFVEDTGSGYFNMFSIDSSGNGLAQLADKVDRFSYKGKTTSGRIIIERRDEINPNTYNIISVKADGTDLRTIAGAVEDERFEAIF